MGKLQAVKWGSYSEKKIFQPGRFIRESLLGDYQPPANRLNKIVYNHAGRFM